MRPLQRPLRNCVAKWRVCAEAVKQDLICVLAAAYSATDASLKSATVLI